MARFSSKKKGEGVGVLGFLRIVVSATMGCFFGCFRMKDPHYHPVSTPKKNKAPWNQNALSSLFLSYESEKDSDIEKGEGGNPLPEEVNVRELKHEAKFLKGCGTLLEIPAEIRRVSGKCVDISTQKDESSNFNSWIPSTPIEKLKLEEQSDDSLTPVKIHEEWVTGAGFLVGTPSSCMTAGHNTRRNSISSSRNSDIQNSFTPEDVPDKETQWSAISSVSSGSFATTVQCTNKSVRFKLQSDRSTFSSEKSGQQSEQSESSGNSSVSKPSPYPTPLKLTDEMQTPGTVFPGYVNIAGGKTTKIRSQYVYSVLNPIDHLSQWKELKEEKSNSNHLRESPKQNDEATVFTTPKSVTLADDVSVGNDRNVEPSLSHWVEQDSANQDGNNEKLSFTSGEKVNCGRSPGDRPILGMVAAHWNNKEAIQISPKMWDGNGIPNSTTKYKEDQKVGWHATPFEERLEKALSEDTLISQTQRKRLSGTPAFELDEIEESDTGSSQLESSSHLKSIVSF